MLQNVTGTGLSTAKKRVLLRPIFFIFPAVIFVADFASVKNLPSIRHWDNR
jgi:hypothetical protein